MTAATAPPRNLPRSTGVVLLGFIAVVVLSLGPGQVLHSRLNLLALSYRILYAIIGSYLAARLAPPNPMGHAMILGFIGVPLSLLVDVGPAWCPIALVLTTLPCAWLGAALYRRAETSL